jgi:hypothetical protein
MTPIGYSKDDQPPHQLISPRGQVHKDRFSG